MNGTQGFRLQRSMLSTLAVLLVLASAPFAPVRAQEPAPGAAAPAPADATPPTASGTVAPAAAVSAPAPAAAPVSNPSDTSTRSLAGHVFTPSLIIRGPFANTSFQMATLAGSAKAKGPVLDNGTVEPGEKKYPFATYGQSLFLEVKVWDGISLRAAGLGTFNSGTTAAAAVVLGTEVRYSGLLGATAGMKLGESVRVAVVADVNRGNQVGLLLLPAILASIDAGDIQTGDAILDSSTTTTSAGISAAWSPWVPLGIIANASWVNVSKDIPWSSSAALDGVEVGGAADLFFGAFTPVPVALTVSYRALIPVDSGAQAVQDLSFGLFYAGRTDLNLGLDLGRRNFKFRDQYESIATVGQISMRYFW